MAELRWGLLGLFKFYVGIGVGGVVVPFLALAACRLGGEVRDDLQRLDPRPGRLERAALTGAGEDLDKAGVGDLTLRRTDSLIRMRCRGPCDDLSFGGGDTDGARLLNRSGEVLVARRNELFAPAWEDDQEWLREPSKMIDRQIR